MAGTRVTLVLKSESLVQIPIFCNATSGILLLQRQRVLCSCKECASRPGGMQEFSCTQFEQHCGAGSAKKWKASLRIPPGGVPEVPQGELRRVLPCQQCWGLVLSRLFSFLLRVMQGLIAADEGEN